MQMYAAKVAKSLLNKGDTLVYLSHFGSVLYGTNSEKSDCDLGSVFVPSVSLLWSRELLHTITVFPLVLRKTLPV